MLFSTLICMFKIFHSCFFFPQKRIYWLVEHKTLQVWLCPEHQFVRSSFCPYRGLTFLSRGSFLIRFVFMIAGGLPTALGPCANLSASLTTCTSPDSFGKSPIVSSHWTMCPSMNEIILKEGVSWSDMPWLWAISGIGVMKYPFFLNDIKEGVSQGN